MRIDSSLDGSDWKYRCSWPRRRKNNNPLFHHKAENSINNRNYFMFQRLKN